MRGKVNGMIHLQNDNRITPAYAGKSASSCPRFTSCRDHPRICGEKERTDEDFLAIRGSPPHMRGKVSGNFRNMVIRGITPAYAGKSAGMELMAPTY